ncbi:MAG: hypothetical protein JNM62_09220 [Flavobacteriales bacterium]|nr:hypothetical protein [Flavobacteriales bacterium]
MRSTDPALQPEQDGLVPMFKPRGGDEKNDPHRQLLGSIGVLLPLSLWFIAGLRPVPSHPDVWAPMGSVSAYYYSGADALFIGLVVAMGFFFFTYPGYDRDEQKKERLVSIVAGIAALMLAFFPTEAECCLDRPDWWRPYMQILHNIGAAALFLCFAVFSLYLFRYHTQNGQDKEQATRTRDIIHLVCGSVIVASLVICAALLIFFDRPIFWPESVGLMAFAVSWLTDGRVDHTAKAAVLNLVNAPAASVQGVANALLKPPRHR